LKILRMWENSTSGMKSASYQSADARRRGDFFGHARGSFSAVQGIENTTDSVALRGLGTARFHKRGEC
jgi:hypothetical protein